MSMILAIVIGIAALAQGTVATVPPEPSGPAVTVSGDCDEAAEAILADWQELIDEWADTSLDEFTSGERIFNVINVPVGGGAGCEPLTATTIATDRAGELVAETSTAALVRGLILADVGEMALYGPGLDLEVPTTPAGPEVMADVESLVELEPPAGASCVDWQDYAVLSLRESVDLAALSTLAEMFGGDEAYLESQTVLNDALTNAFDGAASADCDDAEFLLGMLEAWPDLQATNLTANLAIGGHTDFVYGELFDV